MTETMQTEQVAREFCRVLFRWIPEHLEKCCEKNQDYGDACPTHDFCDANEAMNEAFKVVLKREAWTGCESNEEFALWNDAWSFARQNGYFFREMQLEALVRWTIEDLAKPREKQCVMICEYLEMSLNRILHSEASSQASAE